MPEEEFNFLTEDNQNDIRKSDEWVTQKEGFPLLNPLTYRLIIHPLI